MSLSELDPSEVWQDTWARLVRATRDRRHAFRHPTVATHCPRRGVRCRTVVLRHAEPQDARLTLYTDRRSGKLEALESQPSLSWCFYDGRRRVQVRAESRAMVHVGDAVARAAWDRQGCAARALYAIEPAPATRLAAGESPRFREGDDAGFETFAVVECTVWELDWLYLGRKGHRRIRFGLQDGGWQGAWIVP
jgi:hypothetical protein